jgi:hypothetical protein
MTGSHLKEEIWVVSWFQILWLAPRLIQLEQILEGMREVRNPLPCPMRHKRAGHPRTLADLCAACNLYKSRTFTATAMARLIKFDSYRWMTRQLKLEHYAASRFEMSLKV